jgi:hypothetical protein
MRASRQSSPYVLMGVLALLIAGAIVLSLVTAPPIARQELQSAARNTTAARSFVLDYKALTFEAATSPASRAEKPVETGAAAVKFQYQAPDRILQVRNESGLVVSILIIGRNSYERIGSQPWSELPGSSTETSEGVQVAGEVLSILHPMADATAVDRRGSTYRFTPSRKDPLLENLFGTEASMLSKISFSAVLGGGLVRDEAISATGAGTHFELSFKFRLIGTAPPLVAPARSRG